MGAQDRADSPTSAIKWIQTAPATPLNAPVAPTTHEPQKSAAKHSRQ